MNRRQKSLFEGYKEIDPSCSVIGTWRGNPVIYTRTSMWRDVRNMQHVIILLKNGEPGDLPRNWQDNSEHFVVDPACKKSAVYAAIERWEKMVVR